VHRTISKVSASAMPMGLLVLVVQKAHILLFAVYQEMFVCGSLFTYAYVTGWALTIPHSTSLSHRKVKVLYEIFCTESWTCCWPMAFHHISRWKSSICVHFVLCILVCGYIREAQRSRLIMNHQIVSVKRKTVHVCAVVGSFIPVSGCFQNCSRVDSLPTVQAICAARGKTMNMHIIVCVRKDDLWES
jgi:hypothetical protein